MSCSGMKSPMTAFITYDSAGHYTPDISTQTTSFSQIAVLCLSLPQLLILECIDELAKRSTRFMNWVLQTLLAINAVND